MKITFIGATHEVTGSCTLIENCGRYYLVDCGMEQGLDVFENADIPVDPSEISAVFLTHAHIDHSGMLPKLYKDGFRGSIYATPATADLCSIMLRDSAHIQETEAEWRNRKAMRAGLSQSEPVYDMNDAVGAIGLFVKCPYALEKTVGEGITIRFTDIGHLLGSACIEIWLTENSIVRKIVFSGDVGNAEQPIIKDPQPVAEADYVVIESTYGTRVHEAAGDVVSKFAGYIQKALDRGGNLVIPSFAVGRTQELLYSLREINEKKLVTGHDNFPVYIDSPLAIEATGIFIQCDRSCFDDKTLEILNSGVNPIWYDGIRLAVETEDSIAINSDPEPKVIISASGMCEAGRIRHHLKHNLWDPKNIILFVGFQAVGSLGRSLIDGAKKVKLFGEEIAVNAEIASLHGISGHADRNGLLKWLDAFEKKPGLIFVNHGEDESCKQFCATVSERYGIPAAAPYSGTRYDLITGRETIHTEGIPVEPAKSAKAQNIYNDLVASAKALLALAEQYKGHPNKDIAKLTRELQALAEKFTD